MNTLRHTRSTPPFCEFSFEGTAITSGSGPARASKVWEELPQFGKSRIWRSPAAPDHAMVIFVHGYGGNPEATWKRFPELLISEVETRHYDLDIACFGYSAGVIWNPYAAIENVARQLDSFIELYAAHARSLYVVCHSLGGLVTRRWLVQRASASDRPGFDRVRGVHMIGTPSTGAGVISWNVAKILGRLNQMAGPLSLANPRVVELHAEYRRIRERLLAANQHAPRITHLLATSDFVLGGVRSNHLALIESLGETLQELPGGHQQLAKPSGVSSPAFLSVMREIDAMLTSRPTVGTLGVSTRRSSLSPQSIAAEDPSLRRLARDVLSLSNTELRVMAVVVVFSGSARECSVKSIALAVEASVAETQRVVESLLSRKLVIVTGERIDPGVDKIARLRALFYTDEVPGAEWRERMANVRERAQRFAID